MKKVEIYFLSAVKVVLWFERATKIQSLKVIYSRPDSSSIEEEKSADKKQKIIAELLSREFETTSRIEKSTAPETTTKKVITTTTRYIWVLLGRGTIRSKGFLCGHRNVKNGSKMGFRVLESRSNLAQPI